MAEGGDWVLHVGVGSAAALDQEVADMDWLATIHTGLTQPKAQAGGTSRATTPEVMRLIIIPMYWTKLWSSTRMTW